jgi:phospholipid/cholesterol/gamma-HCH transport system substrate-binding protein
MNDSHIEYKVGLFVAVGLALVALLILNFSRGITLFSSTYNLRVVMPTTAGLKPAADVMMAGVPIGKVSTVELGPEGKSVQVTVRLLSKYKIRKNAVFHIDALGFLGDQYIEVSPPPPTAAPAADILREGDVVMGEAPFNMQEAVRSTAGLLDQARQTMKDLDLAITNVNRTILSDQTLTNFAASLSNFQSVTEIAVKVAQEAEDLIHSNSPAVVQAVTNLRVFAEKFNLMADELDQVILTNRGDVSDAVKNLRDTSASFKQLASGLQAGQGLAGGLLKDQEMKAQMTALLSNASATATAFSAFGSNLNQRGLWRMLWTPKPTERSPAPAR